MRASEYIPLVPARLPAGHPPVLLVVIDTEEEFDWSRPHDRAATAVTAIREVHRAQDIFDRFNITPTYVCDYPIASQELSVAILSDFARRGRAEIGAHLHPWVSPPFDEPVNAFNSYPGNLPPALEAEKLRTLSETIGASFGSPPRIYKAGRYGIGRNTARLLGELGFEVDLSIAPPFNYESDGGPDFTDMSPNAGWIDGGRDILSLPTTGGFTGPMRRYGAAFQRMGARNFSARLHLLGVLSRLGLLNHYRLSPEQYNLRQLRSLTQVLLAKGTRILSFTFHSPSLKPGSTPYVRDGADLERFLGDFRSYFNYFFDEIGGVARTPLEVKRLITVPMPAR